MDDRNLERWLPVPGYEGVYEVSDLGRVRSLTRYIRHSSGSPKIHRGRHLNRVPSDKSNPKSYLRVGIGRDGKLRARDVHALVLEAFVGPRPPGMQCCHYNGNPRDNRLSNLRWDAPSGNKMDDVRNGVHFNASKASCPQGHEYTPENTKVHKKTGHRHCRECQRQDQRARYRRKKGLAA